MKQPSQSQPIDAPINASTPSDASERLHSEHSPEQQANWAAFREYFQIEYPAKVSVDLLDAHTVFPHSNALEHEMPLPFRLAAEMATLEASALRPLRHLGDVADELAKYLQAQSRKIDLMMSYILSLEEDQTSMVTTHSLGGSGFTLLSSEPYAVGQKLRFRLYLPLEACALYGYGEVIGSEAQPCEQDAENKTWLTTVLIKALQERDQELLARACLHQQSRSLKLKAQQKQQ